MTQKSYEQETEEWDNTEHLATDMEQTDVRISGRGDLRSSLAVRFAGDDIEALRQIAEAQDIGVTQLVRTWVLQRLAAETDVTTLPIAEDFQAILDSVEKLMFTVVHTSPTGQVRRRANARVTSAARLQLPKTR